MSHATAQTRPRSGAVLGCIQTGDILVKHYDGSAVNVAIRALQMFGKGASKYTHAAIASSSTSVIEMNGRGLHDNSLLTHNGHVTYDAFRCKLPHVAEGAAETAKMLYEAFAAKSLDAQYGLGDAIRSISKSAGISNDDKINIMLDKLSSGTPEYFFCSSFVVLCYIVAMQQMQAQAGAFPQQHMAQVFGLDDSCYQPAFLHRHLSASPYFQAVGTVRGAALII